MSHGVISSIYEQHPNNWGFVVEVIGLAKYRYENHPTFAKAYTNWLNFISSDAFWINIRGLNIAVEARDTAIINLEFKGRRLIEGPRRY